MWTLKANGVEFKAYGSLWPVWELDQNTISANRGSRTAIDFDEPPNAAPRVVNPPPRADRRGRQAVDLDAGGRGRRQPDAADRPRRARGRHQGRAGGAAAERVAARQLGAVARARRRHVRSEGRAGGRRQGDHVVTFDKPGSYVLRGYAEDASIHTPHDVSVNVVAAGSSPGGR